MKYNSLKSAKIILSKSILDVKNQLIFFKKKLVKNINLGDHFLVKHFFLDSIFEPLHSLKLFPIFDELAFLMGFLKTFFPKEDVDSWPKILRL